MDKISLERIKFIHPVLRSEVYEIYEHIYNYFKETNTQFRITHTFRSFLEQDQLYSQGRKNRLEKNGKFLKKVTNAKGGQSIHNYGLALDFTFIIDKDSDGKYESVSWDMICDADKDGKPDWGQIVNYFKEKGWTWGGDWRSFPDYPHLEKSFGYSWQQLLEKYNSEDTFTEIIDGKIFKWVRL